MSNGKIIIVEDEPKIARILADYLQREDFEVSILHDGSTAVELVGTIRPVLVLLDLMLPGKDGLSICREVRQFSSVPIIMLTAKVDEIDRLVGLELGADDYVCKPFSPKEVVARVRAVLRRSNQPVDKTDENEFRYRGISLHAEHFECRVNDKRLELTPVEFRILHVLIARPGRIFSRNQLIDACYEDNRIVSDRTIDTHIKNLRKKLASAIDDSVGIHSIYGVGYKIE